MSSFDWRSFGVALLALLVSALNVAWQYREARRIRRGNVTVVATFHSSDELVGVFAFISVYSVTPVTVVECGLVRRNRLGRRYLEKAGVVPEALAPVNFNKLPAFIEPGTARILAITTHLLRSEFTERPEDDFYPHNESWPTLTNIGSTEPFHTEVWVRTSSGHVYRSIAERA